MVVHKDQASLLNTVAWKEGGGFKCVFGRGGGGDTPGLLKYRCHVSGVRCHMSGVMCQVSLFAYDLSPNTCL